MFLILLINLIESFNKNKLDEIFFFKFIFEGGEYQEIIDDYEEFLKLSFNFCYGDIMSSLVYCSRFINLKFSYDLPIVLNNKSEIDNVFIYNNLGEL
jgi:hypothetical protein